MAVILGVPCYLYSKPSGPHSARGACNQRLPLQAYTAPPTGGRPYGWRLATLGPVRQRGPKPATASGRGSPTAEAFMEDFAVPGGAEHSKVGGRAGTSSEAMAGARGVSTVHSGHIRQMFTAGPRLTVTVMGPGRAPAALGRRQGLWRPCEVHHQAMAHSGTFTCETSQMPPGGGPHGSRARGRPTAS
jgi:hypothetical protein